MNDVIQAKPSSGNRYILPCDVEGLWSFNTSEMNGKTTKRIDTLRDIVSDATLQDSLGSFNLDTTPAVTISQEGTLSLDDLRTELRERSAFGLWIGLWMLPAIFFSPEIMPVSDSPVDYFSEETQVYMCKSMPKQFHQRLLDLVEEHAENGTL